MNTQNRSPQINRCRRQPVTRNRGVELGHGGGSATATATSDVDEHYHSLWRLLQLSTTHPQPHMTWPAQSHKPAKRRLAPSVRSQRSMTAADPVDPMSRHNGSRITVPFGHRAAISRGPVCKLAQFVHTRTPERQMGHRLPKHPVMMNQSGPMLTKHL